MRLIITFAAACTVLAGCDAAPADTVASDAKPVATTPMTAKRAILASFDCGRARGQAQELVCGDVGLAAMDREVARLSGLAMEPAAQADWEQQRDSCDKDDELRHCVMAAAMLKIHRLRQGSEAARPGQQLSVGPVTYSCQGIAGPVLVTFVTGRSGAAALEWGKQVIAIDRVVAASGAKYEGRWNGQAFSFWAKGKEATLTLPGKGDLQCRERTG